MDYKIRIKEKTAQLIQKLQLETVADKLVGSLPLGWKQKLAFSVALLHEPKIVFWTNLLEVDPSLETVLGNDLCRNKGTTLFVTTHYMDEAEYCDRVSIMVEGRIEALVL
jgi:ABC-2 type transport system ATP-binding protein